MDIYFRADGYVCDSDGNVTNIRPTLHYAEEPIWDIHFMTASGSPENLTDIVTWRASVDIDLNSSTTPLCRTLSTDISVSDSVVHVPWNCRTSSFLSRVNGQLNIPAYAEFWGYNANAKPIFYRLIRITVSAVVDPDGGNVPETVTGYITEAEALAYVKKKNVYQFSADGATNWHDNYVSTDLYYRERKDVEGAEWGAALPLGKSGVIVDNINHAFATTEGQTAAITFTKTALGIASDAEPQLSLWSVAANGKTQINTASYTAVWGTTDLTITYYSTWPAGSWIIKMS